VSAPIPVSFPDDLLAEVRETARKTHLSQQDVIRQSTKLGMPQLLDQFGKTPRPRRLSVWDALASGSGLKVDFEPMRGKVRKVPL